jgi:peroxiredoxin Q/BCP
MGKEYMGMMRHSFVIDAEGKVELIYLKVKAETMANDILRDLGIEQVEPEG